MQDYVNSTEHIVTKLARFHIEFEGVHPFDTVIKIMDDYVVADIASEK